MYKWLSYGNDGKHPQADAGFFQKREFCFTLDGDIFVRYQAFKDVTDMQAAIKARCPAKIDIGPVYSACPAERAKYSGAGQFVPVERELVFDIDLTDYDDVRTCGKGGHICGRCWPLMALAIQVIDAGLRADFGFRHILWVYSGRRGVHCWVADAAARKLSDEQRGAVTAWFTVYKGHEKDRAKLAGLGGYHKHPSLMRAEAALMPVWTQVRLRPLASCLSLHARDCHCRCCRRLDPLAAWWAVLLANDLPPYCLPGPAAPPRPTGPAHPCTGHPASAAAAGGRRDAGGHAENDPGR